MSGGAGTFVAGVHPAGYDPAVGAPAGAVRTIPAALLYDGASRDFPLDASQGGPPYQYAAVHPVDQQVALRLQLQYGSVRSAPAVGAKFHLIPLDDRAAASAANEVDRVLADLVAAGAVTVLRVTVVARLVVTGSLVVIVDYRNDRLGRAQQATNAPALVSLTSTT